MICVEIEVDDDGSIAVGVVPQAMESAEEPGQVPGAPAQPPMPGAAPAEDREKKYLQPAASIDDALAKAKQLLAGGGNAAAAPGALWNQAKQDRAAR